VLDRGWLRGVAAIRAFRSYIRQLSEPGAHPKPLFSNCLRFRIAVTLVVSGCEAVLTVYSNIS
jgi:hypothetical protein